jgi:hypothetical protein
MSKNILGWNNLPAGYHVEQDFALAPLWLKVGVKVPLIERYFYPYGVRAGFVWLFDCKHPNCKSERRKPTDPWQIRTDESLADKKSDKKVQSSTKKDFAKFQPEIRTIFSPRLKFASSTFAFTREGKRRRFKKHLEKISTLVKYSNTD